MIFPLEALKLANECCFPEDFHRLLTKHLGDDPDFPETSIRYMVVEYRRDYGSSILAYVDKAFSRANKKEMVAFTKILTELVEEAEKLLKK